MKTVLLAVCLATSPAALACTYIGEPPSPDDLIAEYELHVANADEIWRVQVVNVGETGAKFEVLDVFKSATRLGKTFSYQNGTSCDMIFRDSGQELIVFGSWINGRLHIFEGNAMAAKHEGYEALLGRLSGSAT